MMRLISPSDFAGASTCWALSAWLNFSAWLRNPTFGFGLNTFSSPAVSVQITSHTVGTTVTHAQRSRFILYSTTVQSVSAIAASIWLVAPNSGHIVQMPPYGSTTPAYSRYPHSRQQSAEPTRLLPHERVALNAGTAWPTRSWIMKRHTRVPASTVVRMKSASKRIAKWYQIAMSALPPRTLEKMVAMPTASVGAPPVRDRMLVSPTSRAAWVSMSGVTVNPQDVTTSAACAAVVPISPAPLFIAK